MQELQQEQPQQEVQEQQQELPEQLVDLPQQERPEQQQEVEQLPAVRRQAVEVQQVGQPQPVQ